MLPKSRQISPHQRRWQRVRMEDRREKVVTRLPRIVRPAAESLEKGLNSDDESDDFDVSHLPRPTPSRRTDPIVLNAVPTTRTESARAIRYSAGLFDLKVAILRRRCSKCAANDRFFHMSRSISSPMCSVERARQSGGVINLKASFITAFKRQLCCRCCVK